MKCNGRMETRRCASNYIQIGGPLPIAATADRWAGIVVKREAALKSDKFLLLAHGAAEKK